MSDFDAIVVGAGIVGAAAAFALARSGRRVALLDGRRLGSTPAAAGETAGTSHASFAWLNATAKTDREDYHRLNAAGLEHYRALAREFGERRLGLHPTGMIAWGDRSDETRRRALRAQVARLEEWGSPVTPLDERGLRALEPHVAFSPGAEGFLAWADGWLDAPRAIDLFCEEVRGHGGTVLDGERGRVVGLLRSETGSIRGVEVAAGAALRAPRVIAALGPDLERALRTWLRPGELGNRPFLRRCPGLLVDLPDTGPFRLVRHVLYTGDNALHIRPGPSGGLRIGSLDTDPSSDEPDDLPERARRLISRTRALLPGLARDASTEALARAGSVLVGVRPVPADEYTIIGPVSRVNGLYLITTHSGVTLGPYLGELAAAELATGNRPAELVPFRFDRFE